MSAPLIVVFGAAVEPDGRPSPALARRIACGLAAAAKYPDAPILCSGGATAAGVSEAAVITGALAVDGVAESRLLLDESSLNTRQNVWAAWRQVRAGGHPYVVACSDRYHLPRIRIMLAALGVRSVAGPAVGGPGFGHRLAMSLRETVAIPHSLILLLARRLRRVS